MFSVAASDAYISYYTRIRALVHTLDYSFFSSDCDFVSVVNRFIMLIIKLNTKICANIVDRLDRTMKTKCRKFTNTEQKSNPKKGVIITYCNVLNGNKSSDCSRERQTSRQNSQWANQNEWTFVLCTSTRRCPEWIGFGVIESIETIILIWLKNEVFSFKCYFSIKKKIPSMQFVLFLFFMCLFSYFCLFRTVLQYAFHSLTIRRLRKQVFCMHSMCMLLCGNRIWQWNSFGIAFRFVCVCNNVYMDEVSKIFHQMAL